MVYFERSELFLNSSQHNNYLSNENVARFVHDSILEFNNNKYDLICFCIMPNHVHIVFTPLDENMAESKMIERAVDRDLSRSLFPAAYNGDINVTQQFPVVTNILRLLKGSTARRCSKILSRTGTFWQHESYDHVVRNEDEQSRIIEYVMNNPVKAKLVDNADEWKWSYCKYL